MLSVLDRIITRKQKEVAESKAICPLSGIKKKLGDSDQPRDFFAAVSKPGEIRLIAEFKRRNPYAGAIRPSSKPAEIVRGSDKAAAASVSI